MALFIISFAYQDRAKNELAGYISRYLGADITFQKVSVSLLRNFPRMRLDISEIVVHDGEREAMKMDQLTILFNPAKMFGDSLDIEKVIIRNALVKLITDENGKQTHLFFLQDSSSGNPRKPLGINSQELLIKNLSVFTENKIKKNIVHFEVREGKFIVGINGPVNRIEGEIKGTMDTLVIRSSVLFSHVPVTMKDLVYIMNIATGEQHLEQGDINLAKLKVVPSLSLQKKDNGEQINLSLQCNDDLNAFLSVLRFKYENDLKQVNPGATASLTFIQQGLITATGNPFTELEFSIQDADLESDKLQYPVTGLLVRGNYNNGPEHRRKTARIVIDTLHARVAESYIDGSLLVDNLENPVLTARLLSKLDLSHLIKPSREISANGLVTAELDVKGHMTEFENFGMTGEDIEYGEISVTDLNLYLKDSLINVRIDTGKILIKDRSLDIQRFYGTLNGENFYLEGKVTDLDGIFYQDKINGTIKADIGVQTIKPGEFDRISLLGQWEKDTFLLKHLSTDFRGLTLEGNGMITSREKTGTTIIGVLDISAQNFDISSLDNIPGFKIPARNMDEPGLPVNIDITAGLRIDTLLAGDLAINGVRGKLSVAPGMISIDLPAARLLGCDADIDLNLNNWNENDQDLTGKIDMVFDTLDVKSFLNTLSGIMPPVEPSANGQGPASDVIRFSRDLNFGIIAKHLEYDLINADSVNITGRISDDLTVIDKFTIDYAGGKVSLEGVFLQGKDNTITGNIISGSSNTNIDELLGSFGNFGQSFLTNKSVEGKVSWNADLYFMLDSTLEPLEEYNFWKFDFSVTEAKLSNVVPVEKALSFIRQKSKENIIVSNMDFSTYFVKQHLFIHDVTIKNSISDMAIFGTYSPADTLLDLDIRLSLSDLLFKSTKKRVIETEDGDFDLGNDRTLSLTFDGTAGRHKVKVATRKDYNRDLGVMQQQFTRFDRELEDKISRLKTGRPGK
jgi:hypothetical protein